MRNTPASIAALLAMASLAGVSLGNSGASPRVVVVDENTQLRTMPAERGPGTPVDTKTDRLVARGRWALGAKARGKRYSASVRQHQRHAAKARNQRRNRA